MTIDLKSSLNKIKFSLKPGTWWKYKLNTSYKYRKILNIECINDSSYIQYKDSMMNVSERLEQFIEKNSPITSKWENFYARLNHLTFGFFY